MKEIIKEVLIADVQARNKLAISEDERENIASHVSEKRPLINEYYMGKADAKLREHKQNLSENLQEHRNKLRIQFEQTSNEIRTQFSSNKEHWIQAIYERCIHK